MKRTLAGLTALSALALSGGAGSAATDVKVALPAYPVARPLPVDDNRLPSLMDDDEVVVADLARDGHLTGLKSEMRIKVSGTGDYVVRLPGPVESVRDLGGDSVPGISQGRVSFLGHLDGAQKVIAAEVVLDPAKYPGALPLDVKIGYEGPTSAGPRAPFTETIDLSNLTAQPAAMTSGAPDRGQLAQLLEALRAIPLVYTPETDLAAIFPVPSALTLHPPTSASERTVYAPLQVSLTLRLDSGAKLVEAPGASVIEDSRGTKLQWVTRLPADTDSQGSARLQARFTAVPPLRTPALEALVTVIPLPAALFTPPSGGKWSEALKGANVADLLRYGDLAQAGMLSLHRIQDVAPPVGRQGPGPERVSYQLLVGSGAVNRPPPSPAPPLEPRPWAFALAAVVAVAVGANAWLLWSRH